MKLRKVIPAVLVPVLLIGGGTAGFRYYQQKRFNSIVVEVVPVANISTQDWGSTRSLSGMITNRMRQEVFLDSSMKISEILVEAGQHVTAGDPLISLDTNVLEMDLKDMELEIEQKRLDIDNGLKRLNKLKNTTPYSPGGYDDPGWWDPGWWDDPWEEWTSEEESSTEELSEEESSTEELSSEELSSEELSSSESKEPSSGEETSPAELSSEDFSSEEAFTEESTEEVLTEASSEEAYTDESREEPLTEESSEEAYTRESREEPLTEESSEEAYTDESREEPLTVESSEEANTEESPEDTVSEGTTFAETVSGEPVSEADTAREPSTEETGSKEPGSEHTNPGETSAEEPAGSVHTDEEPSGLNPDETPEAADTPAEETVSDDLSEKAAESTAEEESSGKGHEEDASAEEPVSKEEETVWHTAPTGKDGELLIDTVLYRVEQAAEGDGSREHPYIFRCTKDASLYWSLIDQITARNAFAEIQVYNSRGICGYILDLSLIVRVDEAEDPAQKPDETPAQTPESSRDPSQAPAQPQNPPQTDQPSGQTPVTPPQSVSETDPEPFVSEDPETAKQSADTGHTAEPGTGASLPEQTPDQPAAQPSDVQQPSESETGWQVSGGESYTEPAAPASDANPTIPQETPAASPEISTPAPQPQTTQEPFVQTPASAAAPETPSGEPQSQGTDASASGTWLYAAETTLMDATRKEGDVLQIASVIRNLTMEGEEGGISIPSYEDESFEYYTAEDLEREIRRQEISLRDMDLERRKLELKYTIKQNELNNTSIQSSVDGVITDLQETGEGYDPKKPLLIVDGGEGFYLTGLIDENSLDVLQPGSVVSCTGWSENGIASCEAEITEISPYPSDQGDYYGGQSSNVSYYPFTAYIAEGTGLMNGMSMDISVDVEGSGNALFVESMYIRKEDGKYFVWAANPETGLLEKRYIQVGKTLYDYYLEVKSGLTAEDKIAVPFGKNIREGVKTNSMSEEADF